MTGRLDARFTSYTLDRIAERHRFRCDRCRNGCGLRRRRETIFIRDILGYHTDLIYRPIIELFRQWDWKHNGNLPTNTAQDFASAMVFDPNLQIFSGNGYFDFATPFFATVYTLNHLTVPPDLQKNITYGFYQSGHMVYMHSPALAQFHDRSRTLVRANASSRPLAAAGAVTRK